jgi:hypothetical protein
VSSHDLVLKTQPDMPPQSGQSFFDGWSFFTGADPTHGQYMS